MKYVSYIYNAFLWALGITVICFSNTRLQMAYNTGYIFFGSLIVLFALLAIFGRKKEHGIGIAGTSASMIALVLAALVFLGLDRIPVAPAAFIREGIGQNRLALGTVNIVLVIVLVAGYAAVVVDTIRHPRHVSYATPEEAKLAHTGRITRWVTCAVLSIAIATCALVPAIRSQMGAVFTLLSSGDINAVADMIRSYGPWAAVVSFLLMILQSLAAPIPAFLITFANAGVFGWWQGAILSWSSAMAGAAVCFYIARLLGRDAVAHFVSNSALESVDRFFGRYGKNAILICRLLPFMSFDYVSYAAGLTGMGFMDFFIATGIGQLPATIVYSYVGGMLTGGTKLLLTGLLIAFALFALAFLIKQMYSRRHADLMKGSQAASEPASANAEK